MEQIFKHPNNINNLCLLIQTELSKNNVPVNKTTVSENVNSNINHIFSKFNSKKAVKDKYNIYLKQLNNKVINKSLTMLSSQPSQESQLFMQQTQQNLPILEQQQPEINEQTNESKINSIEENDFFNPLPDIEENLDNQFNVDNGLVDILENYEENEDTQLSFEEKMKKLENERSGLIPDEKQNQNQNQFPAKQQPFISNNIEKQNQNQFPAKQQPFISNNIQQQNQNQFPVKQQPFNPNNIQQQNQNQFPAKQQHFNPNKNNNVFIPEKPKKKVSFDILSGEQTLNNNFNTTTQNNNYNISDNLENEIKLNEQMVCLNKQITTNNKNYENQILLLNTIKNNLNEINQLQLKYTNSFPEKYVIDSRKLGDKYVNNYSFRLNEPRKISEMNFINMVLPYKRYNIYNSSISYKSIETEEISVIQLKKKDYNKNELINILEQHQIEFDEELNKFQYDKGKIEFIETDITEQLGLTNDSEIDLNEKKYLDFYINDTFVEKINIQNFTKFKINFDNNNEETKELIFSFYEENSQSLHEFNNYHLIEFIIL